jgi:hypothetical protein
MAAGHPVEWDTRSASTGNAEATTWAAAEDPDRAAHELGSVVGTVTGGGLADGLRAGRPTDRHVYIRLSAHNEDLSVAKFVPAYRYQQHTESEHNEYRAHQLGTS